MKNYFASDILESVWIKTLRTIVTEGKLVREADSFLEIQNLQISYHNAFEIDSKHYSKIFGTKFLEYMHRIYSPGGDKDTGRNYYKLIYKQMGVNQVDKAIETLKKNPLSRSAIIILATPDVEKKPCVIEVSFSIRQDLLQMNVVFKSSDFAKKFIPDIIELSHIHEHISQSLHVARGGVTAVILSAQVYIKDLSIIKKGLSKFKHNKYFKTDAIIENWDKEAEKWNEYVHDPNHYVNFENGYSRFLKFMREEIPATTKKSGRIALDSGCGTGIISKVLNKKGYTVIGIDISPKMLEVADKNENSRHYVRANTLDIPYPDNFFDLICSRGVLISHVGKEYVNLFIEEHNRVLKQDGIFMFDFITHFNKKETKKKKSKASMTFKEISLLLKYYGFEVLKRSGEDLNRVNAILCKKI